MMFIIISDKANLIFRRLNREKKLRYKGLEIYFRNNGFYLFLSNGYYLPDGSKTCRLECRDYSIGMMDYFYQIELYVYDSSSGIDSYHLYSLKDFIAASTEKADIFLKDAYLKERYLILKDGFIKANYPVIVNHRDYDGHRLLDGDLVEMLSFRFVYFESFIYVNDFLIENHLERFKPDSKSIRYSLRKVEQRYYLPEAYPELSIEKIEEYKPPEDRQNTPIIKTILPNTVMSMVIGASAYLSYTNALANNQNVRNSLTYFISLIAMSLTGIVLPVIFHLHERRKFAIELKIFKDTYLDYLDEYEVDLKRRIESFLEENTKRYFSLNNLRSEVFYLHRQAEDFLTISLGFRSLKMDLEYSESSDRDINGRLRKIKRQLSDISGFPFLYSLKENRITTIISKKERKRYFFERFILELAYKHHFQDLSIGICSDDPGMIEDYYDLPHLYFQQKRLFFKDLRELISADQKKYDHPLVIFMDRKFDYVFTNADIRVIYFSFRKEDIYKDSDCVIEYLNNDGYLKGKTVEHFTHIEEDFDKGKIFDILRNYSSLFIRRNSYSFMSVFKDLDIRKSYEERPQKLQADFAYLDDQLLSFDLHEKGQGPHGLIGGTTGSGKSELIVSLLLSLCIRYSPEYLNIVLIDYKGGGIRESLTSKGKSLPHIIAAVSNLENNVIEGMIIALNNECRRRQFLFKKVSALNNTSIMNLDDYLNSTYEEKIAHLLIVVDEFAELKKENPEQIRQLISISRIGRSLGVHLILATQKPSGNIDEEIFSNSRFKIALKVFEEKDSDDLIRSKEAAYLNEPGSFYLRVEESLIKARSIYSKKAIDDNEPFEVSLLDHQLNRLSSKRLSRDISISEAAFFVDRINEVTSQIKPEIPELKFLPPQPLLRKDADEKDRFIIGIGDDYLNDTNELLRYDLTDNLLIYSDRKKEVNSFLNCLNENRRKVIFIGNERRKGPFISDSLLYDQDEDIMYLFRFLLGNDEDLCLVIEDLNCLLSYSDDYLDYLIRLLRRSENMRFNFLFFTRSVQISFKLINSFRNRIMINCLEKSDLAYFFGSSSRYKGNCFYYNEELIPFVPIMVEDFIDQEKEVESIIPHIPEDFIPHRSAEGFLLGYDMEDRKAVYGSQDLLITSYDEKLLEVYKEAYGELNIEVYDNALMKNHRNDILFLGPGLFQQRLFISGLKNDLKSYEALYVHAGENRVLRSLRHA
ncbi:MAG: hypothetical protein IJH00_04810 [Erysipelotrichaceae bacterium]|nr:hypothetical protein [Erysipelotrichaceae bacterium]